MEHTGTVNFEKTMSYKEKVQLQEITDEIISVLNLKHVKNEEKDKDRIESDDSSDEEDF